MQREELNDENGEDRISDVKSFRKLESFQCSVFHLQHFLSYKFLKILKTAGIPKFRKKRFAINYLPISLSWHRICTLPSTS
jgi:hypothetical protein